MKIKLWRFIALILAALALGMHFAHALELAPKLQWGADLYLAVQVSLYSLFGTIGPVIEVGALIAVSLLAFQIRQRRPAFFYTLVSVGAIILALIVWGVVVLPANAQISQWSATRITPSDWTRWRDQWQYGQAAIFFIHLIGFSSLLYSVIVETPEN